MRLSRLRRLSLLAFAVLALGACAQAAGIVTIPALPPGSQYRIIFITAGTTAATSTNIATYNTFVTSQASGITTPQTTTWTVVGTTDTVNAITNIGAQTGIPVYNLAGNLVVSTTALLFNGLSTAYANPINVDQNGNTVAQSAEEIWTGTFDGGIKDPGNATSALGDSLPYVGFSGDTNFIAYHEGSANPANLNALYAISGVLTVPSVPTTPAPASFWLIAIGLVAIAALSLYRASLAGAR